MLVSAFPNHSSWCGRLRSCPPGASLAGARVIPVLINGAAGAVITIGGRPFTVMGFIVARGRIVEIDAIADPQRVRKIAAPVLKAWEGTDAATNQRI
jgi:hypothetical protein